MINLWQRVHKDILCTNPDNVKVLNRFTQLLQKTRSNNIHNN